MERRPSDAVDLRTYTAVLRRRWRLIVAATLLGTLLAAAYTYLRTPIYTATAEVLVEPAATTASINPASLVSLDTEARLVRSAPVAEQVRNDLSSTASVSSLLDHVSVSTTPDTLVLDISFWDPDPRVASKGANAFANSYIAYRQLQSVAAVADRRASLENLINDLEQRRDELDATLGSLVRGTAEFASARTERDALNAQVATLTGQVTTLAPTTDPAQVILPANTPRSPSSPNHVLDLALGAFLGLFVGIVTAFVRDRLDDRVRSRATLEQVAAAPVLAEIPAIPGWGPRRPMWLVVEQQPRSAAAEAFRTLRMAVMAANRQRGARVICVVGACEGEGKSAIAANLSTVVSQAGKRVVVVSADLRQPGLDVFFGSGQDELGLADVLAGAAALDRVILAHSPTLDLVPAGSSPAQPAELLGSEAMRSVVQELRARYDVVVIDTPPVVGLADTLAIAPLADMVLLVAQEGSSRSSEIGEAVDILAQVGAGIDGAVFTNVTARRRPDYDAPRTRSHQPTRNHLGTDGPVPAAPLEPIEEPDDVPASSQR